MKKQHYSLIKNFSRLVRSQITKDTTKKKCLSHYTKEELLENHISYCGKNETVAVKMPTKKKTVFSNFKIIIKNFQYLSQYMLILNVLLFL